ncbi:CWC16 protein [Rhexocercosporidium sp. MPI-PUGE-AT-0058]|nr:CWC16 protein [Rhexocercosporidium sp. MPI-PUGE-AT-0058]
MGRYVPPDQEGLMSGNQLHGKHALGGRANKISQGILTVRFEMPYPIWCTNCPKPTIIGQGVRFNAEKKKVGKYFTTPIFSFRMKHVACGGWIEIRTDPKNTAYVVTEGARKRDLGEDKVEEGDVKILTQAEREALRDNAFASLEGKIEDKKRLQYSKKRLEELQELSEKQWDDPYEQNKRLRNAFRVGRKERDKSAGIAASLQDKMSLGLDLLPEHEDDARRARLVDFSEVDSNGVVDRAISKPLFEHEDPRPNSNAKKTKLSKRQEAENLAKQKTAAFAAEIRGNTRAAIDPFLADSRLTIPKASPILTGVKRKRSKPDDAPTKKPGAVGLVDYDSD